MEGAGIGDAAIFRQGGGSEMDRRRVNGARLEPVDLAAHLVRRLLRIDGAAASLHGLRLAGLARGEPGVRALHLADGLLDVETNTADNL